MRDKLPDETDGELACRESGRTPWAATGHSYDHSTSAGRQKWMTERQIAAEGPPPETVGKLSPDASTKERQEWVTARLQGAEIDESAGEGIDSRAEEAIGVN